MGDSIKRLGLSFGTVVSAIAATCCLLPISLAALGLSFGFLGAYTEFIERYEVYAFLIAFVFLAMGFYMAYRVNMGGTVQKAILWVSLALVLIATAYEGYENLFAEGEEEAASLPIFIIAQLI